MQQGKNKSKLRRRRNQRHGGRGWRAREAAARRLSAEKRTANARIRVESRIMELLASGLNRTELRKLAFDAGCKARDLPTKANDPDGTILVSKIAKAELSI